MGNLNKEELVVWKITPRHTVVAEQVRGKLKQLAETYDERFSILDVNEFPPKEDEVFFVAGYSLDNIVGIAKGFVTPAGDHDYLGEASNLMKKCELGLVDARGRNVVVKSNYWFDQGAMLERYTPYNQFSGQGDLLYLHCIAVGDERQGIGSLMLKHMQSHDFEMIETHALTTKELKFFKKNGFEETELDIQNEDKHSRRMVLVWNNPRYQDIQD